MPRRRARRRFSSVNGTSRCVPVSRRRYFSTTGCATNFYSFLRPCLATDIVRRSFSKHCIFFRVTVFAVRVGPPVAHRPDAATRSLPVCLGFLSSRRRVSPVGNVILVRLNFCRARGRPRNGVPRSRHPRRQGRARTRNSGTPVTTVPATAVSASRLSGRTRVMIIILFIVCLFVEVLFPT